MRLINMFKFKDIDTTKLTYKDLQNWFGERGIELNKGDLKKWGNTNEFIYWIPNDKKCNPNLAHDYCQKKYGTTVIWCALKSICFEVESEDYEDETPFKLEWSKE